MCCRFICAETFQIVELIIAREHDSVFGNHILSWCNWGSSSVMCKYDLKDTPWNKLFLLLAVRINCNFPMFTVLQILKLYD